HLVRMAWHPRWHLTTKGRIYSAAPGFMLIVPQEANVVLEYGHTSVGIAGMVATLVSILVLLILVWRDVRGVSGTTQRAAFTAERQPMAQLRPWPQAWISVLWPMALIGLGIWLHLHNPERLYAGAWEFMRANHPAQAADEFDRAFAARKNDAKREEALFWAAKANEQAGRSNAALQRYRELTDHYHGYWLPESLYTQSQLAQAAGERAEAQLTRERLLLEFPNDRWARRMAQTGIQ
ncbi:MAG: hypothetical protein WCH44_15020, partial [Betaproteobacteria bacterium]